jgi:hypothetical protein
MAPNALRWKMIRNYIITFVFVTFRAMTMIPGVMSLAPPSVMLPVLITASWIIPVLAYEAGWLIRDRSKDRSLRASGMSLSGRQIRSTEVA